MENRENNMPEVANTPPHLLSKALISSKENSYKLIDMDEKELILEARTLVLEKEFLKATIEYLKDIIINLQKPQR